jgi:hypothetical protein
MRDSMNVFAGHRSKLGGMIERKGKEQYLSQHSSSYSVQTMQDICLLAMAPTSRTGCCMSA